MHMFTVSLETYAWSFITRSTSGWRPFLITIFPCSETFGFTSAKWIGIISTSHIYDFEIKNGLHGCSAGESATTFVKLWGITYKHCMWSREKYRTHLNSISSTATLSTMPYIVGAKGRTLLRSSWITPFDSLYTATSASWSLVFSDFSSLVEQLIAKYRTCYFSIQVHTMHVKAFYIPFLVTIRWMRLEGRFVAFDGSTKWYPRRALRKYPRITNRSMAYYKKASTYV